MRIDFSNEELDSAINDVTFTLLDRRKEVSVVLINYQRGFVCEPEVRVDLVKRFSSLLEAAVSKPQLPLRLRMDSPENVIFEPKKVVINAYDVSGLYHIPTVEYLLDLHKRQQAFEPKSVLFVTDGLNEVRDYCGANGIYNFDLSYTLRQPFYHRLFDIAFLTFTQANGSFRENLMEAGRHLLDEYNFSEDERKPVRPRISLGDELGIISGFENYFVDQLKHFRFTPQSVNYEVLRDSVITNMMKNDGWYFGPMERKLRLKVVSS